MKRDLRLMLARMARDTIKRTLQSTWHHVKVGAIKRHTSYANDEDEQQFVVTIGSRTFVVRIEEWSDE